MNKQNIFLVATAIIVISGAIIWSQLPSGSESISQNNLPEKIDLRPTAQDSIGVQEEIRLLQEQINQLLELKRQLENE